MKYDVVYRIGQVYKAISAVRDRRLRQDVSDPDDDLGDLSQSNEQPRSKASKVSREDQTFTASAGRSSDTGSLGTQ
jgi:hypothetical protein